MISLVAMADCLLPPFNCWMLCKTVIIGMLCVDGHSCLCVCEVLCDSGHSLTFQCISSAWLLMLDLKLWLSHFNTITKTICVLSLWRGPCHAQFICGQTYSLSCGIHISCFHFQVGMTGTNHTDDLMLDQCVEKEWRIPFRQPRWTVWYHDIIGDVISLNWIQLKILKQQQQVSQHTRTS